MVVNELFESNNVSDSLTNRYISDNTHHNGYHSLYSNAVSSQVANIEFEMNIYRENLIAKGYSAEKVEKMWRKEARKQVHDLIETLRVMNQDGIDMYKNGKGSENQYVDQLEYDEYFKQQMEEAEKKRTSKCNK